MKAIFNGSFDPFTNGHLDVINKALQFFDTIIVNIGTNPSKKPLFDVKKRKLLIEQTLATHPNRNRIVIIADNGLTADIALRHKATHLIRGVRPQTADLKEETDMAQFNQQLAKIRGFDLPTKFITQDDTFLQTISSTGVKNLCSLGEYIAAAELVSPCIHQELIKIYLKPFFNCLFDSAYYSMPLLIWDALIKKYEARAYHNLSHIAYMINMLQIYITQTKAAPLSKQKALLAAIFWHDAIYDIEFPDNEAQSAEQLADYIKKGFLLPEIKSEEVTSLIMATTHQNPPLNAKTALMADLDLAILGTFNPEIWQSYNNAIRKEYTKFDNSIYIPARIDVLQNFVNKKRIYHTDFFYNLAEKQARANLQAEIFRLQKLI